MDDEIVAKMQGVPTASVCDALIRIGRRPVEQMVPRGVRALTGGSTGVAGRARTQQIVRIRDRARGSLVTERSLHFSLVDDAAAGDFIVVGVPRGEAFAVIGDVLALRALELGVVGMATDGAVRDLGAISALGMPVWGSDVTMIPAGYGGCSVGAVDVPISCGGAEVSPGDLVIADQDGIIVVPADEAEEVAAICHEMEEAEEVARDAIRAGTRLIETYPDRSYYARKPDEKKED